MTLRFEVYNETHIFFSRQNLFLSCHHILFQFIQRIYHSDLLEYDFDVEDAVEEIVEQVPLVQTSVDDAFEGSSSQQTVQL